MSTQQRSNLVVGLLLLLVGGWFLAAQFNPALAQLVEVEYTWPIWVISVGVLFLVLSVIASTPGLAVPAAIIAGVGGILYWQEQSGDFASWAYAWTLIPGFVGVGVFLARLMEGRVLHGLKEMLKLVFFSLIMFGIFGTFLGGPEYLGTYWPLLLIAIGAWMLWRGFASRRRIQSNLDRTAPPEAPKPPEPVAPASEWEPEEIEDESKP